MILSIESAVAIEFITLFEKESTADFNIGSIAGEENKEGNSVLNGAIRSVCWINSNIFRDCCKKTGTKSIRGIIISKKNKIRIKPAARLFEWIYFKIKQYIGLKIKARIIPIKIDKRRGLIRIKVRTTKVTKIIVVSIFLTYGSSIFNVYYTTISQIYKTL
jgi:hypothetical protein